jgi:4-hydroxybenzoate polyprenyltransferase
LSTSAVYARRFVSLVKLEHTVFALPYAYAGAILAERGGVPSAQTLGWITLAMVGARSLAMALNRLIDAEIDARNPRTAARELPAGLLSRSQVLAFSAASLALFLIAVWHLPPLTHVLWPIPVAGFVAYPYLKRFTWLCHAGLGAVDGLAPLGGWVAVTNSLPFEPWLLGGAVALWIGGFDIIYATMDLEVDRREGLHSIPRRFGVGTALRITRGAHLTSVVLLVWLGLALSLGPAYWLGVAIVAGLLAYENSIVHEHDLSRVNLAFLTMNGVIALVFLAGVLADALA